MKKQAFLSLLVFLLLISLLSPSTSSTDAKNNYQNDDVPGVLFDWTGMVNNSWHNFTVNLSGSGWYSYFIKPDKMGELNVILNNGSIFFEKTPWNNSIEESEYFHGIDNLEIACRIENGTPITVNIIIAEMETVELDMPYELRANRTLTFTFRRSTYLLERSTLHYSLYDENGYGVITRDEQGHINTIFTISDKPEVIINCTLPAGSYFFVVKLVHTAGYSDIEFSENILRSDMFHVVSYGNGSQQVTGFTLISLLFLPLFVYFKKRKL
ncbi:MAG: hypothetical protein ACXAEU_18005 [Candidatus Hodarchaeales archaeon]